MERLDARRAEDEEFIAIVENSWPSLQLSDSILPVDTSCATGSLENGGKMKHKRKRRKQPKKRARRGCCLVAGMFLVRAGRGKHGLNSAFKDQVVAVQEVVRPTYGDAVTKSQQMHVLTYDHLTRSKLAKRMDQLKKQALRVFDRLDGFSVELSVEWTGQAHVKLP